MFCARDWHVRTFLQALTFPAAPVSMVTLAFTHLSFTSKHFLWARTWTFLHTRFCGMVSSPKSLICLSFAAANLFGDVLRSRLTRGNIPSSAFFTFCLSRLSGHLLPLLLFQFLLRNTTIADLHQCQVLFQFFQCHLHRCRTYCCCLLFDTATFPWPLLLFLPLPFCHGFFSTWLCHLCHPGILFLSNSDPLQYFICFACSLVDSLQREIHESLVSFFSQFFTIILSPPFQSPSESGCRDCWHLVNDWCSPMQREVRCTTSSFLGICSSTGSQASVSWLRAPFPHPWLSRMCCQICSSHWWTSSGCRRISLRLRPCLVQRWCWSVLHMLNCFISPYDRVPRFESLLFFCLLHYSQRFGCCRSVQYLVMWRLDWSNTLIWTIHCKRAVVELVGALNADEHRFGFVSSRLHP